MNLLLLLDIMLSDCSVAVQVSVGNLLFMLLDSRICKLLVLVSLRGD